MPTPTEEQGRRGEIDPDKFDFHQALSALEAHPALQRALGLVFDLDLPLDLVPATAPGTSGNLSVAVNGDCVAARAAVAPARDRVRALPAGDVTLLLHRASTQPDDGPTAAGARPAQPRPRSLRPRPGRRRRRDAQGDHDRRDLQQPRPRTQRAAGRARSRRRTPKSSIPKRRCRRCAPAASSSTPTGAAPRSWTPSAQSKAFNEALESGGAQPRPFYAEDLRARLSARRLGLAHERRGIRCTADRATTAIGDHECRSRPRTKRASSSWRPRSPLPAPNGRTRISTCTRSSRAGPAGASACRSRARRSAATATPTRPCPPDGDDPDYRTDEALTAFKVRADVQGRPGIAAARCASARRYRMRARAVDLAGNSLTVDDPVGDRARRCHGPAARPRGPGLSALRAGGRAAGRDSRRGRGHRPGLGQSTAWSFARSTTAPTRTTIAAGSRRPAIATSCRRARACELAERMGMFDGADGKLESDAATWT